MNYNFNKLKFIYSTFTKHLGENSPLLSSSSQVSSTYKHK